MHIGPLSHSPAVTADVRSRVASPVQDEAASPNSPAVKLELSPAARRPSFPPSPDLKELAAKLEPKDRAQQLAAALDGPGVPVAVKLSTLRLMLADPLVSFSEPPAADEPPESFEREIVRPDAAVGAAEEGQVGSVDLGGGDAAKATPMPQESGAEPTSAAVVNGPVVSEPALTQAS